MEDNANMLLVYLMDRFVCMLLVTVFTTLILQQCGVMATPEHQTTIGPVVDTFEFKMEPDRHIIYNYVLRDKREPQTSNGNRSPVVDGIFNPLTTSSRIHDRPSSASGRPHRWRRFNDVEIQMDTVIRGMTVPNHTPSKQMDPALRYRRNIDQARKDRPSIRAVM